MTFIPNQTKLKCFVPCSEDKVKARLCSCINNKVLLGDKQYLEANNLLVWKSKKEKKNDK